MKEESDLFGKIFKKQETESQSHKNNNIKSKNNIVNSDEKNKKTWLKKDKMKTVEAGNSVTSNSVTINSITSHPVNRPVAKSHRVNSYRVNSREASGETGKGNNAKGKLVYHQSKKATYERKLNMSNTQGAEGCQSQGNKEFIQEDETLEDLGRAGLKLLQKKSGFRFGSDAVLLAHFTGLKNRESVMDLCSGSGIIPILMAGRSTSQNIQGIELQEKYADMANRSIKLNYLTERVQIHQGDLRDQKFIKSFASFDVVTANPPYKEAGRGILNPQDELMIARHEITVNLEDVIKSASLLLRHHGRFCMVHRPERLFDIYRLMAKYGLELKRIRLVAPKRGRAPNMILVEGVKGQKPFLKWEAELTMFTDSGSYTEELKEIYRDAKQ